MPLRTVKSGRLHESRVVEFQAICSKHDLPVRGSNVELMQCVKVHFQGCCKSGVPILYVVCDDMFSTLFLAMPPTMEYWGGPTPCH